MNQDNQPLEERAANKPLPDVTPGEQVSVVLDDIRALVRAEMRYFKSRLDYSRHVVKWSLCFGAIAVFALSAAVIALVVGLVLTLSPHIGPGWATLLVTLGFVIVGSVCGVQARKWVRKVYFPEIDKNDDDIAREAPCDRA